MELYSTELATQFVSKETLKRVLGVNSLKIAKRNGRLICCKKLKSNPFRLLLHQGR